MSKIFFRLENDNNNLVVRANTIDYTTHYLRHLFDISLCQISPEETGLNRGRFRMFGTFNDKLSNVITIKLDPDNFLINIFDEADGYFRDIVMDKWTFGLDYSSVTEVNFWFSFNTVDDLVLFKLLLPPNVFVSV